MAAVQSVIENLTDALKFQKSILNPTNFNIEEYFDCNTAKKEYQTENITP
jgi:hypothetical protein